MKIGLPENFESQVYQTKSKKNRRKKKAKVVVTEQCHAGRKRSPYFSSENKTNLNNKPLDFKVLSSGQLLKPSYLGSVVEKQILPGTQFHSRPFPNKCATGSESEMDWETTPDISVTVNNVCSSRFMDNASEKSVLDDSVIVLDSKPEKLSDRSISVIDEVVIISDDEDSPPAYHSTSQHNKKEFEVVKKSQIHNEKSKQPHRDVICISSPENCIVHPLGGGLACNQRKIIKAKRKYAPFKKMKEDERVETLSDKTFKVSSIHSTPDLKIVAESKTSEKIVTVQNSCLSHDFLPLELSTKDSLSKGQRKRINKQKKNNNNAISEDKKSCEVVDTDVYITPVNFGNPHTASNVCNASTSNGLSIQNKENSTLMSRSLSVLSRNVKRLRPIVVDGSNVAYTHGKQKLFSCKGIELCAKFFQDRGHEVTAFVPQYRRCKSKEVVNQEILERLGNTQVVVFTPSRKVDGILINSYDDRFILDLAARTGGVVVSNDNYRDIKYEKPEWKQVVNDRLLMYLFVGDIFMVPDDPLGRRGRSLDAFLSFTV